MQRLKDKEDFLDRQKKDIERRKKDTLFNKIYNTTASDKDSDYIQHMIEFE